MKNMKRILPVMAAALLMLTACGNKEADTQVPGNPQPSVSAPSNEAQQMLEGTISDIKDFMFVVTDAEGKAYQFTFEGEKPQGLENAEDGDKVMVAYSGEVSEVDPFNGTVMSVEVMPEG